MLNGPLVAARVAGSSAAFEKLTDAEFADRLWLAAFARLPTDAERKKIAAYLAKAATRGDGIRDLVWAVVNTQEFLLQH